MVRTTLARLFLFGLLALGWLGGGQLTTAQELHNETQGIWRAQVIEVIKSGEQLIPGTDTVTTLQSVRAQVLDGPQTGEIIAVADDYLQLDVGERFYYTQTVFINDTVAYGVLQRDRTRPLFFLVLVFAVAVIALSGWQGVRSLVALAASFAAIFMILLPSVLNGWNPLLMSVGVAALVLFGAIFFTHGLNRESAVAYTGTMIAVGITSVFALIAVSLTGLTGFASEGATSLNINTRGTLDLTALLLGSIIIGVLGVLDDISVTQAAVVTELFGADRTLTRRMVFQKALRVGREHVGALVNTLVLAYTGAALPLLLYYYLAATDFSMALSSELFATEIVRMIVGSIGLILTVPIVTGLAVYFLKDYQPPTNRTPHAHSHGHGHSH